MKKKEIIITTLAVALTTVKAIFVLIMFSLFIISWTNYENYKDYFNFSSQFKITDSSGKHTVLISETSLLYESNISVYYIKNGFCREKLGSFYTIDKTDLSKTDDYIFEWKENSIIISCKTNPDSWTSKQFYFP